jgi:hypothetical protein
VVVDGSDRGGSWNVGRVRTSLEQPFEQPRRAQEPAIFVELTRCRYPSFILGAMKWKEIKISWRCRRVMVVLP